MASNDKFSSRGDINKISWIFISTKKVKLQQVEEIIWFKNYTATNRQIKDQFQYMSDLKNSVAAWGWEKVRQLHFEEAMWLKLDIQEWTDIQKKFSNQEE